VNVEPFGTGSVNRTPPKDNYRSGEVVVLSPIPISGYVFDHWSGDLTGTNYPAYVIINADKHITAHFKMISSVADEKNTIPDQFALFQNYPNPFNPETKIKYQLAKPTKVWITICNLQGRLIETLIDEWQPAGYYQLKWNAFDMSGNKVPSGLYVYRMATENYVSIKKMILMK
jgi:uncharacterized repeat protein (TIGR02543 family)